LYVSNERIINYSCCVFTRECPIASILKLIRKLIVKSRMDIHGINIALATINMGNQLDESVSVIVK
jgi:hypothetical protein